MNIGRKLILYLTLFIFLLVLILFGQQWLVIKQLTDIQQTETIHKILLVTVSTIVAILGFFILAHWYIQKHITDRIHLLLVLLDRLANDNLDNLSISIDGNDDITQASKYALSLVEKLKEAKASHTKTHAFIAKTERLAAMGYLLSTITHDINNQLLAAKGHSVLLLKSVNNDIEKNHAKVISSTLDNAIKKVSQTLSFVRRKHIDHASTDLNKSVETAIELFRSFSKKQTTVDMELSEEEAIIWGSRTDIQTALMNLLINADDAIEGKKGSILVQLSKVQETPLNKPSWRICVMDNGHGMPKEELDNVFEMFYTTKADGHGMGLPSVMNTMQKHKGTVKIESKQGQGTAVSLYFPVYNGEEPK